MSCAKVLQTYYGQLHCIAQIMHNLRDLVGYCDNLRFNALIAIFIGKRLK